MPNSIPKASKPGKPARPAGFPLFAHASGRWAKKIKGKLHYFGPWRDPQAALEKWLREKDALLAGRVPRRQGDDRLTIADMCNAFIEGKMRKLESGELGRAMWLDYKGCCQLIVDAFGRGSIVEDLVPDDFGRFRLALAKRFSPVALAVKMQKIKTAFKWAYDSDLIDRPARYGSEFQKPSRKTIRQAKQAGAPKLFTAAEIRQMLGAATVPMRAMILLGINAGYGNSDCAALPLSAVDLDAHIVSFPRPKTAITRRAALWPETADALRTAITSRPTPKDEAEAALVFLTRQGRAWSRLKGRNGDVRIDSIGLEFGKLLDKLGIRRPQVGFYSLRHTYRTVADGARDRDAVDFTMGHADSNDMRTHYVEQVENERLQAVADIVRAWLFPCSRIMK